MKCWLLYQLALDDCKIFVGEMALTRRPNFLERLSHEHIKVLQEESGMSQEVIAACDYKCQY
jgi:hypothetical protein